MRRRRGKDLEDALLKAAWAELTERGYTSFTLESVAKRAETSTPVIYRRWANKALLVEATIAYVSSVRAVAIPDTGTLRGDLITMMQRANASRIDLIVATAILLDGYFAETGANPEQIREQIREQILGERRSAAESIITQAVDRGEIDADILEPRLISLPFDLFRHEVLMTLKPVPDEAITRIVDGIVLPLLTRRAPEAAAG